MIFVWLLAAGCWLLAAGCWLLAAGCPTPPISNRQSQSTFGNPINQHSTINNQQSI